jgi:1,4-alpha-glucan branching enzyme
MPLVPVVFHYVPGMFGEPFPDAAAILTGSWNPEGGHDATWSETPMARQAHDDSGYRFAAAIRLDAGEAGRVFAWGVWLVDSQGRRTWAIPTETPDPGERTCQRSFVFTGKAQRETYHLTHCRRLGANQQRTADGGLTIRFAVWAPNARMVELVFGLLWDADAPGRTLRAAKTLPKARLAGGYIANDGRGLDPEMAPVAMTRRADGVWETSLPGGFATYNHQPYMYRVTRDDGSVVYRTDLYSRCQVGFGAIDPAIGPWSGLAGDLMGTVSCSATVDPETVTAVFDEPDFPEAFIPEETFWADEFSDHHPPRRVDDLVIYELHMGALGVDNDAPGTLADAIALLDHIAAANFNAVELLPLSEFGGGAQNWGYATSHYFAIEYGGGGRDQFKYFVKECHRRGLAVIMDVVYNHFVHQGDRAEFAYDSPWPPNNIYYWYEGRPEDYAIPDGGYVDNQSTAYAPNYRQEMVRKMFVSSAVTLLLEFHVDGLRVDQTTSIHAYNVLHADGRPVGMANIFGAKLLRELGRTVRLVKPEAFLLAEDHSEWDEVTAPISAGGMGFDARWYAGFYHHLSGDTNAGGAAKLIHRAALSLGQGPLPMDAFAGALWATQFSRVVYNKSHDEAGNSPGPIHDPEWDGVEPAKRFTSHRNIVVAANNAPLVGDTRRFAEARCRFAWGMTVLSAGIPMVLFGEEVGASKRFKYNAVLANKEDLHALARGSGRQLLRFYADINRLRLARDGLRGRAIAIVHVHNENRVLAFRRWNQAEEYLIVASLADRPFAAGYTLDGDNLTDGAWREIFNSDSEHYGGANVGNLGTILPCRDHGVTVVVPAAGLVVLEKLR